MCCDFVPVTPQVSQLHQQSCSGSEGPGEPGGKYLQQVVLRLLTASPEVVQLVQLVQLAALVLLAHTHAGARIEPPELLLLLPAHLQPGSSPVLSPSLFLICVFMFY